AAADFANAQGHYTEAQRLLQRAFEDARKSPLLLNSLAWQALYIDDGWDEAIQHARQACDLSGHADPSHLHTFAAVLAASGDVTAAREALSQTLDSRSQGRMTPVDWYPVGRMAEHCGLMEAAIDAYSRAAANDSG